MYTYEMEIIKAIKQIGKVKEENKSHESRRRSNVLAGQNYVMLIDLEEPPIMTTQKQTNSLLNASWEPERTTAGPVTTGL